MACLANNHAMDWGREGLLETLGGASGAQPPQRLAQLALQQLAPLQRGSGSLQRRNLRRLLRAPQVHLLAHEDL